MVDCISGSTCTVKQNKLGWIAILVVYCSLGLFTTRVGWAQEPNAGDDWYPQILSRSAVTELCCAPQSRSEYPPYLPDFSYAGHRWGEQPLPNPSGRGIEGRDFGAVPDDGQDDTRAIQRALQEAMMIEGLVIVRFPSGRFIIRDILFVERSNFVLQGRGRGESGTVLYFPRPMKEMPVPEGYRKPLEDGKSQFSWQGGVIWTRHLGAAKQREIGSLVAGRRGQHVIKTVGPVDVEPGDVVQIQWYNREGRDSSLLYHIYCATDLQFGKNLSRNPDRPVTTQEVTIEEVRGRTIRIKEPLLHDLRKDWTPTLNTVHFLEEVGIEHLRITFPDVEYAGHHNEDGFNGMYLTDLLHGWVRDVTIENADSGILSDASKNVTLEDVEIAGRRGHYSIHFGNVYGMLAKDFNITAHTLHNPSFNTLSRGSVYTDGFVSVPQLDQHRGINHQNLFDNLSLRYYKPVDRLFQHGGSSLWSPTAGAFNTFWNIRLNIRNVSRSGGPVKVGHIEEAPHARLVGVRGNVPLMFDYSPDPYVEGTNEPGIAISSLYAYQLEKRLSGEKRPSLAIYNPLDGYRYEEDESVTIEAEISGDFTATEVRFLADGEEIGTDTEGGDGWSIAWENPSRGFHALHAVARDAQGKTLAARPLSCTGEHVSIWVGGDEGILKGNYPNPFREKTTIQYTLPKMQRVQLDVYDVLGRRVRTLLDDVQRAGENTVEFEARGLASGLYFYHLNAQYFSKTGKATLVR